MERVSPHRTFAGYTRHYWSAKLPRNVNNELVWVKRIYNPEDLRCTTPAPRHKLLTENPTKNEVPDHWVSPILEGAPRSFSRQAEERPSYTYNPASRCVAWSTLRQTLPAKGHSQPMHPPKWGVGTTEPARWSDQRPKRYPHMNSPMTKYVDTRDSRNVSLFTLKLTSFPHAGMWMTCIRPIRSFVCISTILFSLQR